MAVRACLSAASSGGPGVASNLNIKANFEVYQYRVDFIAGPHGAIKGDEHQTVTYGGAATAVTAIPDRGYRFVNWTDENHRALGTSKVLQLSYVTGGKRISLEILPEAILLIDSGFKGIPGSGPV